MATIPNLNLKKTNPDIGTLNRWADAVQTALQQANNLAAAATNTVKTLIYNIFGPSGPNHSIGLVPDPGSVQGTTRFLREDATWQVAGITDQTIHGDGLWPLDNGYFIFRDDFPSPSVTNASLSMLISQQNWVCVNPVAGGTPGVFGGGAPPYLGSLVCYNLGTANNSWQLIAGAGGTSLASGDGTSFCWPVFDFPSWKMVWNFSIGRFAPNGAGLAFNFADTSLYLGLANGLNIWSSMSSTSTSRPPIFVGLRYDNDTTSPSINDTYFTFEANALFTSATARSTVNTQGNTYVTSIKPAEGDHYRFEMQYTSVGSILMTLYKQDASGNLSSDSTTLTVPQWSRTGAHLPLQAANNLGLWTCQTGGAGADTNPPCGFGSPFTISGSGTSLDGSWIVNGSFGDNVTFPTTASLSASVFSGTVTGYPAVVPFFSFGDCATGATTTRSKCIALDFVSFEWNPGVNNSGTPNKLKPRYW